MDKILITDLSAHCIIGVNPSERFQPQNVLVNLTLFTSLARAGETDELADTVDYKAVKKSVRDYVEASRCLLLESLATEIAKIALVNPKVERVKVRIDKPGALRYARTVAVEIERGREDFADVAPIPARGTSSDIGLGRSRGGHPQRHRRGGARP